MAWATYHPARFRLEVVNSVSTHVPPVDSTFTIARPSLSLPLMHSLGFTILCTYSPFAIRDLLSAHAPQDLEYLVIHTTFALQRTCAPSAFISRYHAARLYSLPDPNYARSKLASKLEQKVLLSSACLTITLNSHQ